QIVLLPHRFPYCGVFAPVPSTLRLPRCNLLQAFGFLRGCFSRSTTTRPSLSFFCWSHRDATDDVLRTSSASRLHKRATLSALPTFEGSGIYGLKSDGAILDMRGPTTAKSVMHGPRSFSANRCSANV